jgi:hypothetical protein
LLNGEHYKTVSKRKDAKYAKVLKGKKELLPVLSAGQCFGGSKDSFFNELYLI